MLKTIIIKATSLKSTSVIALAVFCVTMLSGLQAATGSGVLSHGTEQTASQAEHACEWPDAVTLAAVLPVAGEDGSYASGVVFERNRVLTAAHALTSSYRVFVTINNELRQARIVMMDRAKDLAVLSVDTGNIQPILIASSELQVKQPVWAVGFPRASGKETSSGVFTKVSGGALHTSAPIDVGQSGGGLLRCDNGHYELAGMLRGYGAYIKNNKFVKLENHSVSVAASTIQAFVGSRGFTTAEL